MVVRETSTVDKGFLSKMRKTGRRMVVFYGSQTGTAEEFAGRLAKEGARYGFKGIVADPEEENMEVGCTVSAKINRTFVQTAPVT